MKILETILKTLLFRRKKRSMYFLKNADLQKEAQICEGFRLFAPLYAILYTQVFRLLHVLAIPSTCVLGTRNPLMIGREAYYERQFVICL